MSQKRWWLASLSLILMIMVLMGAIVLATALSPKDPFSGPNGATPTGNAFTTPTLPAALDSTWMRAPSGVLGVPIPVPSAPGMLYACGSPQGGATQLFGASHDGGMTWSAPVAVAPGFDCQLSVDSGNGQRLAALIQTCDPAACTQPEQHPSKLFRSTDGGAAWQEQSLPASSAGWQFALPMAWSSGNLFVTAAPLNAISTATPAPAATLTSGATVVPVIRHILAVSSNGGAFTWADQSNSLPVQADETVHDLFGANGSLLLVTQQGDQMGISIDNFAERVLRSLDGGRTWNVFRYQDNSTEVRFVRIGQDGKTILGIEQGQRIVASADNGLTWKTSPLFVPGTLGDFDQTPDGTLFATFIADATQVQYSLTVVSGGAWNILSPHGPPVIGAFTTDPAGHPLFAWGSYLASPGHTILLVFHLAG